MAEAALKRMTASMGKRNRTYSLDKELISCYPIIIKWRERVEENGSSGTYKADGRASKGIY